MKNLLFIFNPTSGKGLIKTKLFEIVDVFVKGGYDVTIYPTQKAGDATYKAKNFGMNYDVIVCSGGDGTLEEVVSGLMCLDRRIPLGYIPSGSTNDFANSLSISKDMLKAAQDIVDGELFSCDVGNFNQRNFIYVAAFGLFTDVSYETDQVLKNTLGHVAYLLEGTKRIFNVPVIPAKVTVLNEKDEFEVIEGNFLYGMVTNSKSVGGFKTLTVGDVSMNDGLFEVCLIENPENPLELNEIVQGLLNQESKPGRIYLLKAKSVRFEFAEEVAWTLDGEFGGAVTEAQVSLRPHAVKLIVKNAEQ